MPVLCELELTVAVPATAPPRARASLTEAGSWGGTGHPYSHSQNLGTRAIAQESCCPNTVWGAPGRWPLFTT